MKNSRQQTIDLTSLPSCEHMKTEEQPCWVRPRAHLAQHSDFSQWLQVDAYRKVRTEHSAFFFILYLITSSFSFAFLTAC